ncbi:MAG: hypothetical protein FIA92_01350 [Chloroflexi bacterium]|nr:hypothetical protein [Chloroflexota bacterium]
MPVRIRLAALLAALLLVAPGIVVGARAATLGSTSMDDSPAVAAAPKVVIVVGATHEYTDSYRSYGDLFAAEALKYTPNVVKVYSPNATWSKVKAAAQGASIFIYLGHGSGYPKSEASVFNGDWLDGMGLNKAADPDDDVVRYYGENYVAGEIRLARNAVVILSHLCYASGNSESGDPEPTYAVARQRIDNFASGFLRAGARTVIADVWNAGVVAYIRDILSADKTIGDMWRNSPSNHGHQMAFAPARNPAYDAIMDPNTWTSGFYRSIVGNLEMTTAEVRDGAGSAFTATHPTDLVAPGAASVATAGLAVHEDDALSTPTGASLAAGTAVRVDQVTAPAAAEDSSSPGPSALVRTFDGGTEGWVGGDGLAPRDSLGPEIWSVDGADVITPNLDGLHDRLDLVARFSETASWTAKVRDGDGTVVATQSGTGHQAFIGWNAEIDGAPAPVGDYTWAVTAADAWGNAKGSAEGTFSIVPAEAPATAVLSFASTAGAATNSSSVQFELVFAGEVSGLTKSDLVRTGTAPDCIIGTPTGSGATWTVPVTKCKTGTLGLTLSAEAVSDGDGGLGPAGWVSSKTVRIDKAAPTAKAPKASLRSGQALESASKKAGLPVRLAWSASDSGGAGLAGYDVARSVNGGAWQVIESGLSSASLNLRLSPGTTYQFRVRARDKAGNVGGWAAGPTLRPKLVQQTASKIVWRKSWSTESDSGYSGGSTRRSSTAKAKAIYTFSGRSIGFVTTFAASRGSVKVVVDGSRVATLDLSSGDPGQRVLAFTRTWASKGTHTIKLVVVGTAGHPRVDLDALAVLG